MSLLQMLKYSGAIGYVQVFLMSVLLGFGPIVLARVIVAIKVVLWGETPRAVRWLAGGRHDHERDRGQRSSSDGRGATRAITDTRWRSRRLARFRRPPRTRDATPPAARSRLR